MQIGRLFAVFKVFVIYPHYESAFRNSFGNVPVNGRNVVVDGTAYTGTNKDISFLDDTWTAGEQVIIGEDGVVDVVVVVVVSSSILIDGGGGGGREMTPTARMRGRKTANN